MGSRKHIIALLIAAAGALLLTRMWPGGEAVDLGESSEDTTRIDAEESAPKAPPRRGPALVAPRSTSPTTEPAANTSIEPIDDARQRTATIAALHGIPVTGRVQVDGPAPELFEGSVRILTYPTSGDTMQLVSIAELNADGTFATRVPAPRGRTSELAFRLVANGLWGDEQDFTMESSQALDVVIDAYPFEGGSITGRVVDDTGEPAAAAQVHLTLFRGQNEIDADDIECDSNGWFRFQVEREAPFAVTARHDAHGIAHAAHMDPWNGHSIDVGALVLEPRGAIDGTVVSAGGTGLAGRQVHAYSDVLGVEHTVLTSALGEFRFALLETGTYEVSVAGDATTADTPIKAQSGTHGLRVELASSVLRVRVYGPDGHALLQPEIGISWPSGGSSADRALRSYHDATTDGPDREFDIMSREPIIVSSALHQDGERWVASKRVPAGGAIEFVELHLERQPRISVAFEVKAATGYTLERFHLSFFDEETRLQLAFRNRRTGSVKLPLGSALVYLDEVSRGGSHQRRTKIEVSTEQPKLTFVVSEDKIKVAQ